MIVFLRASCTLIVIALLASAQAQSAGATSTRKVVLQKADSGYRWRLTEGTVPVPGSHQVLVRVHAVALNRGDLEILAPDPAHDLTGLQVASDAAGDVVAVGQGVTAVRTGARVTSTYFKSWADGPPTREKLSSAHGASVDGVLADYVVLEDSAVVPIPEGLDYVEACTLPTAGLTGWMATLGQRPLGRGDTVVVQGTGGVSTFALQFASAAGARVIVTSSSDGKLERARALGAHDGINYRREPEWSKRAREITAGHGADLVVDVGGKSTLPQSVRALAFHGIVSIVGGLSGYDGEISASALLEQVAQAHGVFVGSRADFLRMNAFIVAHQLRPVVDRTFPLERFDDALEYMQKGDFVGKIVLRLDVPAAGTTPR
jgi:NADPH:quinone reductase-like Zn-dependent oxidoreductase